MKNLIIVFFCMSFTLCFSQGNTINDSDVKLSYAQQIAKIPNPSLKDIEAMVLSYLNLATYSEWYNENGEYYGVYPYLLTGLRNAFAAYLDIRERFKDNMDAVELSVANIAEMYSSNTVSAKEDAFIVYRTIIYNDYIDIVEPKINKNDSEAEGLKNAYSYLIFYYMKHKDLIKAQEYAKRYKDANIFGMLEDSDDEKERLDYILMLQKVPDE